jgi:hypothetical protein
MNSPINFYFLSSGYCGTRFYYNALRPATNAEVWHQPGHEDISALTNLLEQQFDEERTSILQAKLEEFPFIKRRIDKRLALPWVYGDTLNWMRGMGYMLHKYIDPERLRLVALIRHPTATGRSMLSHYRGAVQVDFSDLNLAEALALRWVRQYSMIRYQFEQINNSGICTTIRLEDVNLDQIRHLYAFLGLEGFDAAAIGALLTNRSKPVRHSHLDESPVPASKEELAVFWRICGPLAQEFGYVEDTRLYDDAPTRPVHRKPEVLEVGAEEPDARPPLVKLFDNEGPGLIIRCPSGIHYTNQAAGPICFWLHTEGAYIPLASVGGGSIGRRLFEHFHRSRDKTFMRGVRQEDADFVDTLLAEHGLGFIKVNRSGIGQEWDIFAWQTWDWGALLSSPWEGWLPVRVEAAPYNKLTGVMSGVDSADAVLVWENSN